MSSTLTQPANTPVLRAAVIGLGIGRRHITAYQEVGCRVTAAADLHPEKLEHARETLGVPFTTTDYRQVLARDDADVVSICTPDGQHAQQAIEALTAGKHVLCEKPLATSLQDALRVCQHARATGRTLAVTHNYRCVPQFARLKALVDDGAIGEPYLGESCYVQDLYAMEALGPGYWRLRDPQDLVLGGAVHNVDLLRWTMGEVEEVQAYARNVMPFYQLPDNYVVNLRFCGGGIGRLLLALGSRLKTKFRAELNLYGSHGMVTASMTRPEVVVNREAGPGEVTGPIAVPEANSHAVLIADFVAAVRGGRTPMVDGVEGAKAVAVCEAIITAAREGRPVAVDHLAFEW